MIPYSRGTVTTTPASEGNNMGFLGLSPKFPACLSQVQVELFEAVRRGDEHELQRLVNRYDEVIRHEFPAWTTQPKELRGDPRWSSWYGNGLLGVAEFYQRCGVSTFIQLMMGDEQDNPIHTWQVDLGNAQQALNEGRFDFAISLLLRTDAAMETLTGSAIDTLRPMCLGMLGAAHFKKGNLAEAERYTTDALALCRKHGDNDGVAIYQRNLAQIRAGNA